MKTFCNNPISTASVRRLESIYGWDSILLDKQSCDILLRIERQMNQLECMGTDDMRKLWIETGSKDKVIWFEVLTRNYNGVHSLFLSSQEVGQIAFETGLHQCDQCEIVQRHSAKAFLSHLEKYLNEVIDRIEDNAEAYNDYVEKNLSHYEREGCISAKEYYSIMPEDERMKAKDALWEKLDLISNAETANSWNGMTLEKYIHAWRVAYEGYHSTKFDSKSDLEVFFRSSKGNEVSTNDLSSQDAFKKWCKDCSPYHCYDILYARASLYPVMEDNGKWHFSLQGAYEWNLSEMINAALALANEGIPFIFDCDTYRRYLNNDYMIDISNEVCHYSLCEPVLRLPHPGEDVSQEQIGSLINAIQWKSIEKVKMNSKK